MGLFDLFDQMVAEELGTPVENYIEKIESVSEEEQQDIILPLLSYEATEEEKDKAKELFFNIE